MKEQTEGSIRAVIASAQQDYQKAVATKPIADALPIARRIKALQAELAEHLAAGATPCPLTEAAPIGMRKRPGVYEVGPIGSPLRARGETAAGAVEAWNAGQYVPPTFKGGDLVYEPVGLEAFVSS